LPSERSLTHAQTAVDLVQRKVGEITKKALETVEGLFVAKDSEGYNPDAERNWAECSTKTRVAAQIVRAAQDSAGTDPTPRVLGVIFLKGRSKSKEEWEAEAAEVDQEARRKVIEAEVVDE